MLGGQENEIQKKHGKSNFDTKKLTDSKESRGKA